MFALETQEGLSAHFGNVRRQNKHSTTFCHLAPGLGFAFPPKNVVYYWKRNRLRGSVAHRAIWFVFFCKLDV